MDVEYLLATRRNETLVWLYAPAGGAPGAREDQS
jgi:hypothetical protein